MKPKKNPNADLKKRTGLFFSIGLAVATFASLYAINYKTSEEPGKRLDEKEVFDIPEDVTDFRLEDNSPPPQQEPEPPKEVEAPDFIKDLILIVLEPVQELVQEVVRRKFLMNFLSMY